MAQTEEICFGCGLAPVVQVNDRKLCGNCFLIGISVSLQSTVSHAAELETIVRNREADETPIDELRSTLLTAIEEIQRLRLRLDELARENSKLRTTGEE
jgi:hypothetical protein